MKIPSLLVGVMIAMSLVACGEGNPPCETLPKPSQVEQEAARGGAEVEREVTVQGGMNDGGTAECVVVGDRWVDQTDE